MNESIDDLLSQGRDEEVKAIINSMLQEPAQTPMPTEVAAGVLEAITSSDTAHNTSVVNIQRTGKWRFYAACAAMIITILGAGYFWFYTTNISNKERAQGNLPANGTAAILPGGDNAILTLSDGRQIILDSSSAGGLALQGTTKVLILDKGKLAYQAYGQKNNEGPVLYNTVSTPNGGQYQIVLPDGTHVWLNAASSIRFPTTFTGERNITMTGEAYFEVAHDSKHPFKVNANKLLVEVLGTHFNVSSYANEQLETTLLEGAVKVTKRETGPLQSGSKRERPDEISVDLKPGEQAVLSRADSPLTIDHSPNLEQVMAWKNGLFNLSGADLKDFLRQVERWYGITVQYESPVPFIEFQGKLNRAVPLSDIIEYLKNLGIECSLKGKTLSVKGK